MDIHFDDRNFASLLDPLDLLVGRAVKSSLKLFSVLNEFFVRHHLLELSYTNEVEVTGLGVFTGAQLASSGAAFAFEEFAIGVQHRIDQSFLSDARRTHNDEGLALEGSGVERVEVLFGIHKNVVLPSC